MNISNAYVVLVDQEKIQVFRGDNVSLNLHSFGSFNFEVDCSKMTSYSRFNNFSVTEEEIAKLFCDEGETIEERNVYAQDLNSLGERIQINC